MSNVVRFSLGRELIRAHLKIGESLLPAAYLDYRARVRRWRDALRDAGEQLEAEREARARANAILETASLMDAQLRQTESEHGWKRIQVP